MVKIFGIYLKEFEDLLSRLQEPAMDNIWS
jgi:hypothetical protein